MSCALAAALLALGMSACTAVAPQSGTAGGQQERATQAAAQTHASSAALDQATQQAVQALAAQLKLAEPDVIVVSAEPHTWPDSSLGCGKPGTLALQVITHGYVVLLSAQGKQYRMHVANGRAELCDKPVLARTEPRRPASVRGLEEMVRQAREDLARRIGTDAAQVRLLRTQPHQWPDNGLDCPRAGETIVAAPVVGHRILLEHSARTYTYHTDLKTVRPCPSIEAL